MDYLIRPARIEDAEAIFIAHKRAIYEICSKNYSEEQIKSWMPDSRSATGYIERIQNLDNHYFIIEVANILAGFASYRGDEITGFYFHPDFVGKGLATALFQAIENAIKHSGHHSIELQSTITAMPFYQKMGMQMIEQIEHRFQTGVTALTYKMFKSL